MTSRLQPAATVPDERHPPRTLWTWIAIAGLLVWLFGIEGNPEQIAEQGRSAVGWMLGRWNWPGADMSHGWLIPLVSGYAIWHRRKQLQDAPKSVDMRGLALVVTSLIVYLLGVRAQQTRVVLVSAIGLLWGIPWFIYGRPVARLLTFPAGYLLFCIPTTFLEQLTLPLRLLSTITSTTLLNGLGIAAHRIGTAIYFPGAEGFALDVAHPCSGLRYLVSMVALTTAYAYFTQQGWIRRCALFAASVPLAVAGNMVRILLIGLVGLGFGSKVAMGFYHDYSGYVVFAVAILLMTWTGSLLQRWHPGGSRK